MAGLVPLVEQGCLVSGIEEIQIEHALASLEIAVPAKIPHDGGRAVFDGGFGNETGQGALYRLEIREEGDKLVSDSFEHGIGGAGHLETAIGEAEKGFAYFAALLLVAVEEGIIGSARDGSQFPGEVGSILDAGVHALST